MRRRNGRPRATLPYRLLVVGLVGHLAIVVIGVNLLAVGAVVPASRDVTAPRPQLPRPGGPPPPPGTAPAGTAPAAPPVTDVPPAGSSACRVLFTPTDQWRTGFTADIVVTNSGPPVDGWTLRFPVASGVRLVHGWNGEWSQQANVVSVRSARWNRALPTGRSVTVGLAAQHGGQAPPPSGFTLDGAPCG